MDIIDPQILLVMLRDRTSRTERLYLTHKFTPDASLALDRAIVACEHLETILATLPGDTHDTN